MDRRTDKLMLFVAEHGAAIVLARRRATGVDLVDPLVVPFREAKPQSLALAAESVVNALADHVRKHGWRGMPVRCLIGGSTVTSQYFDMPALKPAALQNAIRLKLSQQLHYNVADAQLWVGKARPIPGSDQICVGAAAVNRAHVKVVTDAAERIGLTPVSIAPGSNAVAALGSSVQAITGQGIEAVLYLSEFEGLLLLYRDNQIFVSTELSVRLADLTAALTRPIIKGHDVLQLDEFQARKLRDEMGIPEPGIELPGLGVRTERILPVLEPVLQQLTRQLTQWFAFARTTSNGATVANLKLIGPGARIPGMAANIGQRLKCPASNLDWNPAWASIVGESTTSPDELAATVGAALTAEPLPDLTPPEIRRRRKFERIRRYALILAPSTSAALLVVAFALNQIHGNLKSAQAAQAELLHSSRLELIHWQQWQADAAQSRAKSLDFAEFARTTPAWEGIFREFSQVLPDSVQLTSLVARVADGALILRLSASVRDLGSETDFDEVVEQSLGSLNASPYFAEVEVLSAVRSPEAHANQHAGGTLIADLKLTYALPKKAASREKP